MEKDKAMHAVAGALIGGSFGTAFAIMSKGHMGAESLFVAGVVAAIAGGVAKEIWESRTGAGRLDWWDAVATAAGGALGAGFAAWMLGA